MSEKILISQTKLVEAKEFPVSGKSTRQDRVLKECLDAGYQSLFMPELIRARITAPKDSRLWQTWWSSPSLIAYGQVGRKNLVVVAHVPNYFSENPQRVTDEINKGLIYGAGRFPQEELERLVNLRGERVLVIPYEQLRKSISGVINVSQVLNHSLVIPFLGVSKEEAEVYLAKYKEVYDNKIGIWHYDNFQEGQFQQPLARFLFLGDSYNNDLGGNYILCDNGRVLGVSGEAGIAHDQGDDLVKIVSDYIGPEHQSKIVESLRGLYPSEEQIRTVLEPHFGGTPFFDEIISRVKDQYQ